MASQEDVRRIAMTLPGVSEGDGPQWAFSVRNRGKDRGFVWAWKERVEPRKPKVVRDDVLAVRVIDQEDKAALLASDERVFFTEPHYNGFPAVLVRLPEIELDQLVELVVDAWRCLAPPALVEAWARDQGT